MFRTKGHSLGPVVLLACAGLVASVMAVVMADLLTRPAAAESTAPEPVYAVRNLGTLGTDQTTPGAGTSIARDINDSGQVTGQSQSPSGNQGFLWEDGKGMKPIGTLGGLTSPARGINKNGQVVGFSRISSLNTNTQVRAYSWEKEDPPTNLGTLAGFANSEAWSINDSGMAVGRSFNNPSVQGDPTTDGRAVLWENGQTNPEDLNEALRTRFSETAYSEAWGINNLNQVVGEVGAADQQAKAFLYDKGTNQVTDIDASLDRLVFPYLFSEAAGINDAGQVIGWSYRTAPNPEGKAFLYGRDTDGTPTVVPLEPVVGKPYSRARDIDEEGQVVGWSRSSSGTQAQQFSATLWKDGKDGKPTDLNDLIPASERWDPTTNVNPTGGDSGWKLTDAYAINENGQIVGAGFYYHKENGKVIQSQLQAFLLTPDTTEPSLSVNHTADGSTGWNKTSPVTLKVTASDSSSGLDGAPACTEGTTNLTLTAGTWTANISGEGTHSISCSVTDKTGNTASASDTVKIDTQAVSSLASANSYSNSSPITVNYNTTNAAADTSGLAKVELWVKGPNDANFTHSTDYENNTDANGSFSYPVTQDGDYHFYTIAEDNAGNREAIPAMGADAIVTLTHDTVAPTLTASHIGANADGWNNSSPVTLNVAASDSGSGLDGAPTCTDTTTSGTISLTLTAGNTGEWTASVSGEGTHTVKCSVSDKAGNPSGEKTDTVKIDTKSIQPLASASSYSNTSPISVNYSTTNASTDTSGLAKVELWAKGPGDSDFAKVDEKTTASGDLSYAATQDGVYSFYTMAEDNAGNRAPNDVTIIVTHDTVAPTLTVSHAGANADGWNKTSPVSLTVLSSDAGSGLAAVPTCTDGSTALTLMASPRAGNWTASVSGEGVHSISCTSKDKATNTTTKTDTVRIDTTPPSITGSRNPLANANGWNNSDVTVSFSCNDGGAGLDAGGCPADATVSSEGANQSATGIVTDKAGNTASDTVGNINIDKTPIPSKASANNYSNSSHITVGYNTNPASNELSGLAKVELWAKVPNDLDYQKVDTNTTDANGSFSYVANQGDGDYRFYTIAEDKGGNRETQPPSADAVITLTPDTAAPILTVNHTANANGWNKTSPVTLTVLSSDAGSGLAAAPTCTDASTTFTLTASPTAGIWTASVSGEGTHDVSCSVSDNVNNSTNASDTVKIDTIAPSISDLGPTTQPNAAGWYKTDVTNRFKATDSGSGLDDACKTAFPANAAGNNVQSKTTSGEGSSLKVTSASCTDVAGNTATGIDSATFKIDKTAPKVSAATPTGTGIGRGTNVVATFSERMGPASITNSTFTLFRCTSSTTCTTQVTNVILSKSTDGLRATINPYGTSSTLLAANTKYKVVVTTGTQDLAGNALDQDPMTAGNQQKSWTFTTKG